MSLAALPFARSRRLHGAEPLVAPASIERALLAFAQAYGFYSAVYIHFGHAQLTARSPIRLAASSIVAYRQFGPALASSSVGDRARATLRPFAWSSGDTIFRQSIDGIHCGVAVPVQDHASGPALVALIGVDLERARTIVDAEGADLAYAAGGIHLRALATLKSEQSRGALTRREIECLRHAALGRTVMETGAALGIAGRTVEFHLKNVSEKLGAANKIHAVAIAVGVGLIQA